MKKNNFFVLSACFVLAGMQGCIPPTTIVHKSQQTQSIPRSLVFGLYSYTIGMNLKIYDDPDKDLISFKTFGFDYTNAQNPLLEKELFKMLEKILIRKGLKRNEQNPELRITMNFYTGKKETYVPPETITTTRVEQVWTTGHIGWTVTGGYTPVSKTEQYTKPGYTAVQTVE